MEQPRSSGGRVTFRELKHSQGGRLIVHQTHNTTQTWNRVVILLVHDFPLGRRWSNTYIVASMEFRLWFCPCLEHRQLWFLLS